MAINRLIEYLDQNEVNYKRQSHKKAYTAQEAAAAAHISGREMAKTVIVKLDGRLFMAVLPASFSIDFEQLKRILGVETAGLAAEQEFKSLFPDCDTGAMPPFGNLYGMGVLVDNRLAEDDQIAFHACSHTDMIMMSYRDYERLVKPKVLDFVYDYEYR